MGETGGPGQRGCLKEARSKRYLCDLVKTHRDAVVDECSEECLNLIVDDLVEAGKISVGGNIYQRAMDPRRSMSTPRDRARAFWEALPELGHDGFEVMMKTLDRLQSPLTCTLAVGCELIVFQHSAVSCSGAQGSESELVYELVSAFGRLRSLLRHPVKGRRSMLTLSCSSAWRNVTMAVGRTLKTSSDRSLSPKEVLCLCLCRVLLAMLYGDADKLAEILPDLERLHEPDVATIFATCCRHARSADEQIGLVDVLLYALSAHKNKPRLVERACVILWDWFRRVAEEDVNRMRRHLVDQGILKTLSDLMIHRQDDSDMRTAILNVLALVADGDRDIKLMIGNLALPSQALVLLHRHKRDPALSAAAARLLRTSTFRCPENGSFLTKGNFVPIICKTLQEAIHDNPTEDTISFLQNCCGCLANVFSPLASLGEVQKNTTLIESMQTLIEGASNSRNRLLHATLCNIIANIGSHGFLHSFATVRISNYVTDILRSFQDHDKCLEMALHAIAELMHGSRSTAEKFVKIGGVSLVTAVFKEHEDSDDIIYAAFHVLFRLCAEHDEAFSSSEETVSTETLVKVVCTLQKHTRHEDTVLFALAFFQLLVRRHKTLGQVLRERQMQMMARQAIRDFPKNRFVTSYSKKLMSLLLVQ